MKTASRNTRPSAAGVALAALATAATLAACGGGDDDAQEARTAAVRGPIAQAAVGDASRDYPFYAAPADFLASKGYQEQEYFVDGRADCWSTPRGATGEIVGRDQPYTTRLLVRRPADAAKANGIVLVEWLNGTLGYDLDHVWVANAEALTRAGYTWVGVTLHHANVLDLKRFSPSRYAALNVEPAAGSGCAPSPAVPAQPVTIAAAVDSMYTTSSSAATATAFDILGQLGRSLRKPGAVDPLGGLPRRSLIAIGGSRSASLLVPYINSVHAVAPVYDGFMLYMPNADVVIRGDQPAKVFKFFSELDLEFSTLESNNQPDTSQVRTWHVAGAAHASWAAVHYQVPVRARDGKPSPVPAGCPFPILPPGASPGNRFETRHVFAAAMDHLGRWTTDGTAPPSGPRIPATFMTSGQYAGLNKVTRDAFGNVVGGIRLAQIEAPTASYFGGLFCGTTGWTLPFDAATRATLYPSPDVHINTVIAITQENVRAGHLLPVDAQAIIQAAQAGVGP